MRKFGAAKTGPSAAAAEPVIVGKIVGVYGVRGWVKVFSYTRPPENILQYDPWHVRRGEQWTEIVVREARQDGKGIVASLAGYEDRDVARTLIGAAIGVAREQLPALPEGEYYWTELVGLRVENADGAELGRVERFFETGAHDVMVVRGEAPGAREYLIPFAQGRVITQVDRTAGVIRVDWDTDF